MNLHEFPDYNILKKMSKFTKLTFMQACVFVSPKISRESWPPLQVERASCGKCQRPVNKGLHQPAISYDYFRLVKKVKTMKNECNKLKLKICFSISHKLRKITAHAQTFSVPISNMADHDQDFQTFNNVPLEDDDEEPQVRTPKIPLVKRILNFVIKNYLPLSLIFLVFFGILVPAPGAFLAKYPTHYACIVGLFLHSGIKLKTGEIKEAVRAYRALLLEIVIIMFITPVIGVKLTGLLPFGGGEVLSNNVNVTQGGLNNTHEETTEMSSLGPESFKIGIQMYFIVPCTISAGVVLVSSYTCTCIRVTEVIYFLIMQEKVSKFSPRWPCTICLFSKDRVTLHRYSV